MKSVRLDYPMGLRCRAFGVSRSGFYAWLNRAPSPRVQEDERLKVAIKAVHVQTRETYGPLRVQPELDANGQNRPKPAFRPNRVKVCLAVKSCLWILWNEQRLTASTERS